MVKIDPVVFGKWQLEGSEHFGDFLEALGVGYLGRILADLPRLTISSVDDETIKFKQQSFLKTSEFTCEIGKTFDETTADGRKVESLMTAALPHMLKHEMKGTDGGKDSRCIRTFSPQSMRCVCYVDKIRTIRTYTREK